MSGSESGGEELKVRVKNKIIFILNYRKNTVISIKK
jgi:hypothetical protein